MKRFSIFVSILQLSVHIGDRLVRCGGKVGKLSSLESLGGPRIEGISVLFRRVG